MQARTKEYVYGMVWYSTKEYVIKEVCKKSKLKRRQPQCVEKITCHFITAITEISDAWLVVQN